MEVFIKNGYPERTVWTMLYQENQQDKKGTWDLTHAFHAPYHPKARRLFEKLRTEFGLTVIYKRTKTLGDLILKKGRDIEKQYKKNTVYKIPCAECPKVYAGQSSTTLKKRCQQH